MVQVKEIEHVDTRDLSEGLRSIGIDVHELMVKVSDDGLTLVEIKGCYIPSTVNG